MSARKRYAREFKIEAVKLVTERGLSQKQVARDLGLDVTTLRRWIKECSADAERVLAFRFAARGAAGDLRIHRGVL